MSEVTQEKIPSEDEEPTTPRGSLLDFKAEDPEVLAEDPQDEPSVNDNKMHETASDPVSTPDLRPADEANQNATSPNWANEVASSRVGRQSRASSIFSTRTKFSTLTLDDARSIEISAGGQSFRISRDGSRITDVTAPPPYPGPPVDDIVEESREVPRPFGDDDDIPDATDSAPGTPTLPATRKSLDEPAPQSMLSSTATKIFRNALGMNQAAASSPSASPELTNIPNFLRRTQSDTSSYGWLRPWSRASAENSNRDKSIPQDAYSGEERPYTAQDCDFAQMNSHESMTLSNHSMQSNYPKRGSRRNMASSVDTVKTVASIEEVETFDYEDADRRAAAISSHYSGLMRDMDREHRRELHEKDKELSQFRQLLNEKDVVLRQALRDKDIAYDALKSHLDAKDAMIEVLKSKLAELEDGIEAQLEKARNSVEDIWEMRWKNHEKLLLEKLLAAPGQRTKSFSPRRNREADVDTSSLKESTEEDDDNERRVQE